ncbi:MAG: CD3072 family TudS-related putative desulfidase [Thermoproteota archaeon]
MFDDVRGGKVAVVSHCILNQNSRVSGLSERSSMIEEVVDLLREHDIGILQMPCPELKYAGILRERKDKGQYDTEEYRECCRSIAGDVVDQILEYMRGGIDTELILGINVSPSCGVSEDLGKRGYSEEVEELNMEDSGVLMEELYSALRDENLKIPFYGIRYKKLKEELDNIKCLIED